MQNLKNELITLITVTKKFKFDATNLIENKRIIKTTEFPFPQLSKFSLDLSQIQNILIYIYNILYIIYKFM